MKAVAYNSTPFMIISAGDLSCNRDDQSANRTTFSSTEKSLPIVEDNNCYYLENVDSAHVAIDSRGSRRVFQRLPTCLASCFSRINTSLAR